MVLLYATIEVEIFHFYIDFDFHRLTSLQKGHPEQPPAGLFHYIGFFLLQMWLSLLEPMISLF